MPDDTSLLQQVRPAVQQVKLPARAPNSTWEGRGVGAPCQFCGVLLGTDQMELEIEFDRNGDSSPDSLHLHIRCFAAWEFERTKASETPSARTESLGMVDIDDSTRPVEHSGTKRGAASFGAGTMTSQEARFIIHERLQERELPRAASASYGTIPGSVCDVCRYFGVIFSFSIRPEVGLCADCFAIWNHERTGDLDR